MSSKPPQDDPKANRAQVSVLPEKIKQQVDQETASHPTRRHRAILFEAYLIAAIAIFAVLAFLARTAAYFAIDLTITRDLQTFYYTPLEYFMRFISWFGFSPQSPILLFLLPAMLFASRLRWEGVMTFFAGIGVSLLNFLVKVIIQRPRPSADLVNVFKDVTGYSFPSGHVMFYTAFFGFLFFLTFTLFKPSWRRTLLLIAFGGLVAFVGVSRIYLGEHWFSDVLAAYLLGSLFLALTIRVYRWGKSRFFVPGSAAEGA